MRFLFTTLQYIESDFYGRVGERLGQLGHEAVHLTWSRRAAGLLRRSGARAHCMPELMRRLGPLDLACEADRIGGTYPVGSLKEVWRTDWPCRGRSEEWCLERTVRHFVALERLFELESPDVVVPEVGSETMRTAAHLVGLERRVPVLFLFYTIFPRPLRLYVDTLHAPITDPSELRELEPAEREELREFVREFTTREAPIRAHRTPPLRPARARLLARHAAVRAVWDRDNEYLRPARWLRQQCMEQIRPPLAARLYQAPPDGPFVYFPLHVVDDYKIERVVPHLRDQRAIVERLALSLPPGYELVVKEHPLSIGRNSLGFLWRLRSLGRVRLVQPRSSSHELIRRSSAVAVIGSTVGLEALLYAKPVLTLGRPFYSGAGVTLDLDSPAELEAALPELLRHRPDPERVERFLHAAMRRCRPGAPVLVDRSGENARTLAHTLEEAGREELARRSERAPTGPISMSER